ncbi:MAG: hypothetical protein ABRQ38_16915 [Candidatus Eremiobacterota bacterium]
MKLLHDPINLYKLLKQKPDAVSKEKYNKLIDDYNLKESDEWPFNLKKKEIEAVI